MFCQKQRQPSTIRRTAGRPQGPHAERGEDLGRNAGGQPLLPVGLLRPGTLLTGQGQRRDNHGGHPLPVCSRASQHAVQSRKQVVGVLATRSDVSSVQRQGAGHDSGHGGCMGLPDGPIRGPAVGDGVRPHEPAMLLRQHHGPVDG